MFVVLRKDLFDKEEETPSIVINIFKTCDKGVVCSWICNYLESEIKSSQFCPRKEGERNVSYEIKQDKISHKIYLVKHFNKIQRGYFYNASQILTHTLIEVQYCAVANYCKEVVDQEMEPTPMWKELNLEINNRIMKQLDKDSIYQVFQKLNECVSMKHNWTSTEYIQLLGEVLSNFRKDFYSSIVKKLKRYGDSKKKVE